MRSFRSIVFTLAVALALVSCRGNSEAAKKRYVESGDKYFSKGRYKEARIQYLNAIRIDQKYGLAYYKLALTALKQVPPDVRGAVGSLRRAKELIHDDQPEHWDAVVTLSEIYLEALKNKFDQQLMAEVKQNCDDLLTRDKNSFDGHRLRGDWMYVAAAKEPDIRKTQDGRELLDGKPASGEAPAVVGALGGRQPLDVALEEYRKADSTKPGDLNVNLQIGDVLFARGNALAKKGDVAAARIDYSAAEQIYRKTIDQKGDLLLAYGKLYSLLGAQNKRAEAEQLLKAGYQNNPKQYGFLITLANLYLAEGRRDDMLNVLGQLKSKVGEYPKAYLDVGDFYLRSGDPEAAVREYREGITKDPKNRIVYQKRIVEVRMRQNKPTEAADANDEILKENKNDADANSVKATLELSHGDVGKALVDLQQVVARTPENFVAHFNLGRAYASDGNTVEQARQQFQKAVELRPDYTPARVWLAWLQLNNGEFDAAIRSAQDILKYDPNNTGAKLIWSAALMEQKKFGESRQMLGDMLKANPSSPDILYQIGLVNLAESKFKDAEDAFRRCYQLNPANARGLMGVVETYLAQNKIDQAIQLLRAEIAKTPARADFHLGLANVGVRAGRWDMALSEYQTVLSTTAKGSKTQGEMYLRIGETQRLKGDLNAAILSLQAARQTLPDDKRVLSTLALVLDNAGKWPDAEKIYQAANKLYPNEAVVLNNLAFGMAEHGEDLDQALSMAQKARQLRSNLPEISDTLGWIYLKKNLPDNALQIFQGLVAAAPNQATFRYHLGMALSQKGDKLRALQELKKALEGSPSDPERKQIQELITRLG